MKIIRTNKIIDLDKFETVEYGVDHWNDPVDFLVKATRWERDLLGSTKISEEILRLKTEEYAKELIAAITKAWIEKKEFFDIDEWLNS